MRYGNQTPPPMGGQPGMTPPPMGGQQGMTPPPMGGQQGMTPPPMGGANPMIGQAPVQGGVINLSKGSKVDLTKGNASLTKVMIGIGWDIAPQFVGAQDYDLDASVFMVDEQGRTADCDFIFYNNLTHHSGGVIHQGDNRTGEGDGDDEQILIEFAKIPANIQKIAIAVTIDQAVAKRQSFGQVQNAFLRVVDVSNAPNNDANYGRELMRYDLAEEYSSESALVIAEVYRYQGNWKVSAVGSGFNGDGLASLCRMYGLNV